MKLLNNLWNIFFTAVPAVLLVVSCVSAPSNKWRIEVSEGAKSAGQMVFRVNPVGQNYIDVTVNIAEGQGENYVAKEITRAFRAQLPQDRYNVERDDGEDVLIKKRKGVSNFGLQLISTNVKAVRINLDRE